MKDILLSGLPGVIVMLLGVVGVQAGLHRRVLNVA
jgi:hypothetical protein